MNSKNKLLAFSQSIPDFRLNRKKLYPSENIVFITILAVICGAETWEEIEDYGVVKHDFLETILGLENGIPSHDTFNRFFSLLKPAFFEEHFITWVKSISNNYKGVVAIDGKTVRGSKQSGLKSAIHLVSAFSTENEVFLGQIKTAEKSNEITAIPELLKILDLEKAIVTIDAMGCQTEIAQAIIEQKADYILAVKENQKELYLDIESAFLIPSKDQTKSYTTEEIGSGRIEKRICTVIDDMTHLTDIDRWKSINTIIKIDSERFIKSTKQTQTATRYYISSLPCEPNKIAEAIRSHWKIENNLHWHLDVSFREDKSRKRYKNAAQNFSSILKLSLKILLNESISTEKKSIRRKRKIAGWDNHYLLSLFDF
jgi:predicted transposase YbfD/YdcC